MHNKQRKRLRIGELAYQAGTSTDTIRYYERLGLLSVPVRSESGYRLYTDVDVGQLLFIRRAKLLGLSLDDIRGLLGLAGAGACSPLRQQVAELLRQKIDVCEAKLAELKAFKVSLEECYQQVLEHQDEESCTCSAFPASCTCLPVRLEELTISRTQELTSALNERSNDERSTHQQ